MLRFILRFVVLIFCQITVCSGQEIPPIQNFFPKDYEGGDQNWAISQDKDRNIYVANNKGLLEFNGAKWTLYPSPNQAIVRSVSVIDNKIYTGSYMDFGYWQRNTYGELQYKSLSDDLGLVLIEDEEFWNIIPSSKFILFQSLDRIYIYDSTAKSVQLVQPNSGIKKAFKVKESIYFQTTDLDLYEISNGRPKLFLDKIAINSCIISNVFNVNDELLLLSKSKGFFVYTNGQVKPWQTTSNRLLSNVSVYSSIQLRNGNFILGTISNGVIKLDVQGSILFSIDKKLGLPNNTVLSAFQDISGNVWLGLDNGINLLNLNSPYKMYKDGNGALGTVYASALVNDVLYLGTNQGLFFKEFENSQNFEPVRGTKGQVWFLDRINDELFCGHDKGSFSVSGDVIKPISAVSGTWSIKTIPDKDNQLIQGNYDGLSIIEKTVNGNWQLRHKIDGFNISSRYFEFISPTEILVSHEYKGVYKLKLNTELTKVSNVEKISENKGIGSGLVKYNDKVYYAYEDGIYVYNNSEGEFEKSTLFEDYFTSKNYISGKLIYNDKSNRLWAFLKNQLVYLEPGKLSSQPIYQTIDLPNDMRQSKAGFENILEVGKDNYLLGTAEGYIILNTQDNNREEYRVRINTALYSSLQKNSDLIDLDKEVELKNSQTDVFVSYSLPNFVKLTPSYYQYKLEGIYDNWSSWSTQANVLFENLPHGDYVFKVRGRVGSKISTNVESFKFSIERPWYLKPLAIIIYVLLFILILGLIHFLNRRYYKNQKQKLLLAKEKEFEIRELENERQIMKFKNKTLEQDIESKNRELGISTMNLIRKNEFLNSIKSELDKITEIKDLNKVKRIIDKNINNTEDWKFFEEAFNNADKDFLKKVKNLHPSLTPNDLKLCAYLRLNLSSKEIAPLLNISHRSVEVKRYRLRKKMNLPHEESLTNYIIQI